MIDGHALIMVAFAAEKGCAESVDLSVVRSAADTSVKGMPVAFVVPVALVQHYQVKLVSDEFPVVGSLPADDFLLVRRFHSAVVAAYAPEVQFEQNSSAHATDASVVVA